MAKTDRKTLIACLRAGDLKQFRALLGTDPEAARSAEAVVEAGRLGSTKALELLLKKGADLNAPWRGYRALHALIQEAPHKDRETPTVQRVSCLNWLLAHGANPEALGGWPATRALITAAFAGQPAYIEELRRAGAVVDAFVAAALGDIRKVERALAKDSDFAKARDSAGLSALHCCAGSRLGSKAKKIRDNLLAIARILLDHGAEVEATVRSWSHDVDAVYLAVSAGQREVFALLLERGADPIAALPPVVWRSENELAELALSHGATLDRAIDDGKPLLNNLVRWGQVGPALWMLERGASPNIADDRGWTAVHQAASRGNEKVMKAVLAAGGDAERSDNEGSTPIDIARANRRGKIVALLGA